MIKNAAEETMTKNNNDKKPTLSTVLEKRSGKGRSSFCLNISAPITATCGGFTLMYS